MRKSRFTEAQIIGMIKEQKAGKPTAEVSTQANHSRMPSSKASTAACAMSS